MALVKSRAATLRSYRVGETSRVVVCYTRDHGKVRLVAKGVRKGGGRLGAALEPMVVSGVVFYLHEGRELSLVSQAEVERQWPELRRDVVRMAYAAAALELVDALVPEREPDPALFDLVEGLLERVAAVPEPALDPALWSFELALAGALGYGPDLTRCVACGREFGGTSPAAGASLAVGLGGILCDRCFGKEPGAHRLSGAAAAAIAGLPGNTAGLPGNATGPAADAADAGYAVGDAGVPGALTPIVRDEVSQALRAFLEEHAGRELRLKSLDFLSQLRRTEHGTTEPARKPPEPEQTHEG